MFILSWEEHNFPYEKQELGLLKLHCYFSEKYVLIFIALCFDILESCSRSELMMWIIKRKNY